MKYCSKCGNELFDEAVVCPKCGCATEDQAKTAETKNQANNQIKGAIFILAGLAIIAIVIIAVMMQLNS